MASHQITAAPAIPSPIPSGRLRCDILLFVVTSSEKNQIKKAAKEMNLPFQKRPGRAFDYYDLGQVGAHRVLAVKTEMGPFS